MALPYPKDGGLKKPVRRFEDTFSAITVVKEMFFEDRWLGAEPITSQAQIDAGRLDPKFHLHCAAGNVECGKSAGQFSVDGVLRCAFCHAPFVRCTPDICNEAS